MTNVFLSHSFKDKIVAEAVRVELRARDIGAADLCDAVVPPGHDLRRVTDQAIDAADAFLVLWSRNSATSAWVDSEVKSALRAWSQEKLVIAALDDSPLPAGLRDQVAVRLGSSLQDFAAKVAREVQRRTAAPLPRPDMAPAPSPGASKGSNANTGLFVGAVLVLGAVGVLLYLFRSNVPFSGSAPATFDPLPLLLLALAAGCALLFWQVGRWALSRRAGRRPVNAPSTTYAGAPAAARELFISYSRKDSAAVDRLVNLIQSEGIGVWIDRSEQDIGGRRYAGPIVRAIRDSKAVAVMCSRHAFNSDHVVREVYVAGDFKKPFLNVHLDSEDFPDDLRYFLTGFPRVSAEEFEQRRPRQVIDPLLQHGRS